MHQHLRAGFDLQLFTTVHGQRSCATSTADNQPDRRAFAASGYTADNRAHSRANAGTLDRLLGPAAGFDSAFFVSTARIFAVDSRDVAVQHSFAPVAQLDRIKREIHAGPAFNLA